MDCDADRNYLMIFSCLLRVLRTRRFEPLGGKAHDEETAGFFFLLAGDSLCLHLHSSPTPHLDKSLIWIPKIFQKCL